MRHLHLGILGLTLITGSIVTPSNAHASPDTTVRVKKAIADTMTPEELAAYTERLAANFANRRSIAPLPADTCDAATYETALPFGPTADTTVGETDNYDLPPDTTNPTCTAATTCTGGGPAGSLPRGAVYTGTGTGPDRSYKIRTDANCALTITMDPTGAQDMALIVYQATCSSLLGDCACVDDSGAGGTAESVTLDAVANTDYFIVVDGYSTGATPPGPSGPFTLSITGAGCNLIDPIVTTTTSSSSTTSSSTSTTTTTIGGSTTTTTIGASTTTTTIGAGTTTTTVGGPGTTTTTIPVAPTGCPGGVKIGKPVVKITKLDGTPGTEGLLLSGILEFKASAPFDPTADGAQVLLEDLGFGGAVMFDLTTTPVPAGAQGTGCGPKDGWKGPKYKNKTNAIEPPACPSGSAQGLHEVLLKDKRADGGGIMFKVKAKNANLGLPIGPLRMTIMTSGDPSAASSGLCGSHTFEPSDCAPVKKSYQCK